MDDLNSMRSELRRLRKEFLNGNNEARGPMHELAERCAATYNAKAKEIAKRHGVRPRLTTAAVILRRGEF
ncbi:MAG: hypothetical protein JNJ45_05670 [Chthonomonas sp.]|nr:hypothetical protein [Chthonomonas sp.]